MSSLIQYFKTHQKISLAVILLVIFLVCFATHFFIYKSNGYAHTEYYNLLLARNWAQTGLVSFESNENVVLSSTALITRGANASLGNKLTWLLYGILFRLFGFHPNLPLYTSFILYSLAAVGIFLLAWRLFGLKIAAIAAGLNILAPFSLPNSITIGYQEWGLIFLVAAALIYFWPQQRTIKHLIITGLLLGLSVAARNSFFIAFFPFLALEFWSARADLKAAIKKSLILSAIFLVVTIPFILIGGNTYLNLELYLPKGDSGYESSIVFNHFFPDPYTFHYDREDFLKNIYDNANLYPGGQAGFLRDTGLFLPEYGASISFWQKEIVTRIYSTWIYFKGLFLSAVVFGGLLTWLFIFIGLADLKKRKSSLVFFATSFFVFWLAILIVLRTANYQLLLILSLPLTLVTGVGVWRVAQALAKIVPIKKLSKEELSLITAAVILVFFAQLSWWSLRELFGNGTEEPNIFRLAQAQQNKNPFDKQGVTAVGWSNVAPTELAYYFDRNFINFVPQTVQKLAAEGKLNQVFKNYNITGFIGYDEQLTNIINKNTDNKFKNY